MNNAENEARRVDLFGDRWPEKEGQVDDPNSGGEDQERAKPRLKPINRKENRHVVLAVRLDILGELVQKLHDDFLLMVPLSHGENALRCRSKITTQIDVISDFGQASRRKST